MMSLLNFSVDGTAKARSVMALLSHAGNGIVKCCKQWHCRGEIDQGMMLLPSFASDGAAKTTLPWHDVATKSF
jgi:hypothetical protein